MNIEKLIEDLRIACAGNQHNIMGVAATALSTLQAELDVMTQRNDENLGMCKIWERRYSELQAENEKLREELEQVKAERDVAVEDVLDAAITPCSYCAGNPINGGSCDMDNETHEMYSCWKWRGKED